MLNIEKLIQKIYIIKITDKRITQVFQVENRGRVSEAHIIPILFRKMRKSKILPLNQECLFL